MRVQARTRVINIRSEFNTHLNENVKMPVDLAEVEDLCKMIEEKDEVLMLDLMRVKDQINHNLVASEGWSANAKTASAIQVDEVIFTERNLILSEQENLQSYIKNDNEEIAKLAKIIDKYQKQSL